MLCRNGSEKHEKSRHDRPAEDKSSKSSQKSKKKQVGLLVRCLFRHRYASIVPYHTLGSNTKMTWALVFTSRCSLFSGACNDNFRGRQLTLIQS